MAETSDRTDILSTLATLVIGAAAAGLAVWLGLPAPYLTGPAACVSVAAVLGLRAAIPIWLRNICFLAIGLSMGAGVNPEILAEALNWPISLISLSLGLVVIFLGGAWILQRHPGLDRVTARLSSTPGHLSYTLSLSTELPADLPTISVVQTLRVLTLTLLVPAVVALVTDADLSMGARPGADIDLLSLAGLSVAAAVAGLVLLRLRVPAAFVLGGFLISALSHGTGLTPGKVPDWMALPSFTLMGIVIGTRFAGIVWAQIRAAMGAAMILTLLSLAVTTLAAYIVHLAIDQPMTTLMIAYAPGGLETMAALSIMLEADPTFVAFHHAYRLLFLTVLVPFFLPLRSQSKS